MSGLQAPPRSSGTPPAQLGKKSHCFTVRVYYEDTDFSGYVYHANYLKYCERARSDFLRVAGIDQNALYAEHIAFVVRKMVCDFLRPAKFEDELVVETLPKSISGARMELQQRVVRGEEILFTADVMVALIDGRGRPCRVPADMAKKLQAFVSAGQ